VWDTTEGLLIRSALYASREDIVLLLLRACPSEVREPVAGKVFVLACLWALPHVVQALLLPPSADAGEQQTRHEKPEERTRAMHICDPWMLRTGEESSWKYESELPLMLAAFNAKPEAVEVVDMLVHAMGPGRALNYICGQRGLTVMHMAVQCGRLDIVRLLVEKYGAPSPVSPQSALSSALYGGHLHVLQYLAKVQCMPVDVRYGHLSGEA